MKMRLVQALFRVALIVYGLTRLMYGQDLITTQPDCQIFFTFTATGSFPTAGFDNRQNGCTTWNISYANSGFSALTLALQSAPNNGGAAGTWVTYAGATIEAGINPNTSITQNFTWLVGYNPWVRVALTAATGSGVITGVAYGFRVPSAGAAGFVTTSTNVAQWGGVATSLGQKTMASSVPVAIASDQSALAVAQSGIWTVQPGNTANTTPWLETISQGGNAATVSAAGALKVDGSAVTQPVNVSQWSGATAVTGGAAGSVGVGGQAASAAAPVGNPLWWAGLGGGTTGGQLYPITACSSSAVVTVSAAATTELVALTASQSIRVCSFALSISLTGSAQFVYGTGTNCGSGTTNLTGAFSILTGVTSSQGAGFGELFKTAASNALCLTATVGNVTGVISYAKY